MNASTMEDFTEHSAGPTKNLYMSDANSVTEKVVEVNLGVSTFTRAPGEAPGTAVLEIAMDELAEKLKMDPVQLRLVNYAEKDPSHDRPWTDKHLRDCYTQAAQQTHRGHAYIGEEGVAQTGHQKRDFHGFTAAAGSPVQVRSGSEPCDIAGFRWSLGDEPIRRLGCWPMWVGGPAYQEGECRLERRTSAARTVSAPGSWRRRQPGAGAPRANS